MTQQIKDFYKRQYASMSNDQITNIWDTFSIHPRPCKIHLQLVANEIVKRNIKNIKLQHRNVDLTK